MEVKVGQVGASFRLIGYIDSNTILECQRGVQQREQDPYAGRHSPWRQNFQDFVRNFQLVFAIVLTLFQHVEGIFQRYGSSNQSDVPHTAGQSHGILVRTLDSFSNSF